MNKKQVREVHFNNLLLRANRDMSKTAMTTEKRFGGKTFYIPFDKYMMLFHNN